MAFESRLEGDGLGPLRTVLVREPRVGLEAIVVVDNVACGLAIGGVRMARDLTVREVARLARAMTLKNAAAGLPHGGAKSGICHDPSCPEGRKEELLRAFARAIRSLADYIPGPDMGTDEHCMAWIQDEIGRATGLPRVMGGIPLDEVGATGFGLAVAAEVATPMVDLPLRGARVAIQGFGAVGRHAARFLAERGARIVAVADSRGAIHDPAGLPIDALVEHKRRAPVTEFPGARTLPATALLSIDCDIWIPAARPDALTIENVPALKARLVLQGANVPATDEAERWLHEHGVLSVPDFIANAGGVICAATEHRGGTQSQAFAAIAEKVRENTQEVLQRARKAGLPPRAAALELARGRVGEAMVYRRP